MILRVAIAAVCSLVGICGVKAYRLVRAVYRFFATLATNDVGADVVVKAFDSVAAQVPNVRGHAFYVGDTGHTLLLPPTIVAAYQSALQRAVEVPVTQYPMFAESSHDVADLIASLSDEQRGAIVGVLTQEQAERLTSILQAIKVAVGAS